MTSSIATFLLHELKHRKQKLPLPLQELPDRALVRPIPYLVRSLHRGGSVLGFLPTRAYRPGTPGATTFLSPLSGTFNYGWDSFGSTPPIRSRFASSSSISRSQTESCPTDHGPAVPDSGSGPCGISCPSTHPIVSSLHGWTASAHVALGSCLARGGSRLDQAGCRTRKGSLKCLSLRRPRGVQDGKGVVGAGEERVLETIPGHRRKYRSPQRHHRVNR